MQREIKFRYAFKTIDGRIILEFFTLKELEYGGLQSFLFGSEGLGLISLNKDQFTGETDKNGREIYEHDVVRIKTSDFIDEDSDQIKITEKISYITFRTRGFWVDDEYFGWEGEGLWNWNMIEVIGNIHENPELYKIKLTDIMNEDFEVTQTLTCVNIDPFPGKSVAPPLELNKDYTVKEIIRDGKGFQHLDVGLPSEYNYITSQETGEKLERGDDIHWCHPSRFELKK